MRTPIRSDGMNGTTQSSSEGINDTSMIYGMMSETPRQLTDETSERTVPLKPAADRPYSNCDSMELRNER